MQKMGLRTSLQFLAQLELLICEADVVTQAELHIYPVFSNELALRPLRGKDELSRTSLMAFPARIEATLSLARLIHPPKGRRARFFCCQFT